MRLKNMFHECKYVNKSSLQRYILFVLLFNFEKIKWCFNNNIIKALCMAMGHTLKAFIIIIIKTPFYLLKVNY